MFSSKVLFFLFLLCYLFCVCKFQWTLPDLTVCIYCNGCWPLIMVALFQFNLNIQSVSRRLLNCPVLDPGASLCTVIFYGTPKEREAHPGMLCNPCLESCNLKKWQYKENEENCRPTYHFTSCYIVLNKKIHFGTVVVHTNERTIWRSARVLKFRAKILTKYR